mmetsp:Transcript_22652/g.62873  ORF Transcript_22652/g.62873 Transcript_22652/m.62873 type:complete len:252 (+) Transcript_22652:727-1482(+)
MVPARHSVLRGAEDGVEGGRSEHKAGGGADPSEGRPKGVRHDHAGSQHHPAVVALDAVLLRGLLRRLCKLLQVLHLQRQRIGCRVVPEHLGWRGQLNKLKLPGPVAEVRIRWGGPLCVQEDKPGVGVGQHGRQKGGGDLLHGHKAILGAEDGRRGSNRYKGEAADALGELRLKWEAVLVEVGGERPHCLPGIEKLLGRPLLGASHLHVPSLAFAAALHRVSLPPVPISIAPKEEAPHHVHHEPALDALAVP